MLPIDTDGYAVPENMPIRTYVNVHTQRAGADDTVVTGFDKAGEMIERTDLTNRIAIPVELAQRLGWFPPARYRLGEASVRTFGLAS